MGKTADLKKLITAKLNTTSGQTYHRRAPIDAAFPYKVFTLAKTDSRTDQRDDIDLCVDVWDHSASPATVEAIADAIEDLFDAENMPQDTILPTFYRESRFPVEDDDPEIQREQLHFYIHFYENKEE